MTLLLGIIVITSLWSVIVSLWGLVIWLGILLAWPWWAARCHENLILPAWPNSHDWRRMERRMRVHFFMGQLGE